MEENKTCKHVYIPAAPHVTLSETAKYQLLMLVPRGRLTTDTAIRSYLAKMFGVHGVEFERVYDETARMTWEDESRKRLNLHREVSDSGIINPGCEDELREEGFELIPSNRSKGNLRVKDFKRYLFDFEKECTLTIKDFKKYKKESCTLNSF